MFNFTNNLRAEISGLFFSKTLKNTGVVFTGSIIASGFSLITLLILSRTLGPHIFGILSLINSVVILLISLTDFGMAVGLSKFVAPLDNKSSGKAVSFFRTVFWIEIILGLTTIFLGLIFLGPISYWLGGPQLKGPLIIGFIVAGMLSLYAYVPIVLQALQRFWAITVLSIVSNFLKFLLVLALFYMGYLTLWNALYTNLFVAIIILPVGLFVIPGFFFSKINWLEDIKSAKTLLSFTKWLAISYCLNAVAARLDILMLSHFKSSAEVGYYALAFQLSLIFPLLLSAASTVLIPKVSSFQTGDQIGRYMLKSIKASLIIIPVLLLGVFIAPFVVKLLFGSRFINAIPILQILLLNYLLILIINPVSLVMYALNKQKILTFMNAITLVTLFILQIYLIPGFGGIGAALALFINTTIAMCFIICLLFFYIKQGKIKL